MYSGITGVVDKMNETTKIRNDCCSILNDGIYSIGVVCLNIYKMCIVFKQVHDVSCWRDLLKLNDGRILKRYYIKFVITTVIVYENGWRILL